MSDFVAPLLYLSSSTQPLEYIPFVSTPYFSFDSPSATFLGSSCFDYLVTCSSVIPPDDPFLHISSTNDDFGSFAASCSFRLHSLSPPNPDVPIHIYDLLHTMSPRFSSRLLSRAAIRSTPSSTHYIGYADGASRYSRHLASAAWAIFTPMHTLVLAHGVCIGTTTNNQAEYAAVHGLLADALSHRILHM